MSKRLVAMGLLGDAAFCREAWRRRRRSSLDGPEWTFEVPLSELDDTLLVLANPLSPLEDASEPKRLVSVVSRKSGENGENVSSGIRKAAIRPCNLTRETYNALTMLLPRRRRTAMELYIR